MNEVSISDEVMAALETELLWANTESRVTFMSWLNAAQNNGVCHFLSNGGLKMAVEAVNAEPRLRTFILNMTERFIASLILKEVFVKDTIGNILSDLVFKSIGGYRELFSSKQSLLSESFAESLTSTTEDIDAILRNNIWIFTIYVVLIANQDSAAVQEILSKYKEAM